MAAFPRVFALALCIAAYSLNPTEPVGSTTTQPPPPVDNNLTINVDDRLTELYLDGVRVWTLPNANDWIIPDRIPLPGNTKVIAVLAENSVQAAVLVASDLGGWVLSDRFWKYSTVYFPNWMKVNFDDSAWNSSYMVKRNDGYGWVRFPCVSRHASLIWSPNFLNFPTNDNKLYFRLRLNKDVLRRNFDWIASDQMVQGITGCFHSRRIQCASSCSQRTSLCAGFQHHKATDTCCFLSVAELQFGGRMQAAGWKIWSSIVLNEPGC